VTISKCKHGIYLDGCRECFPLPKEVNDWVAGGRDSLVSHTQEYQIWKQPEYAGGWKIGGNWTIYVTNKPTDEQIKHTEEYFGWEWIDK
jgi:hypothetical protein